MKASFIVNPSGQISHADVPLSVNHSEDLVAVTLYEAISLVLTREMADTLAKALRNVWVIKIHGFGSRKIEAIKWVREVSGLGLKEAKDLVEASEHYPQVVREFDSRDHAEAMVETAPNLQSSYEYTYPAYRLANYLSVEPVE
jgi:ribosomal protein L7/L12